MGNGHVGDGTEDARRVKERTMKRLRKGLTLIELVVVLAILVALAGILVPLLSGYLERAHGASASTNIGELVKTIETFHHKNQTYPDGWDSLLNSTTQVPYDGIDTAELPIASATVTVAQAGKLNAIGVTTMFRHVDGSDPRTDGTALPAIAVDDTEEVATLTQLFVQSKFGVNANTTAVGDVYVAFGIGNRLSLVGDGMVEAPIHYSDEPGQSPALSYQRFIAVFRIPAAAGAKARLVGVLSPHGRSLNEELNEYFVN